MFFLCQPIFDRVDFFVRGTHYSEREIIGICAIHIFFLMLYL